MQKKLSFDEWALCRTDCGYKYEDNKPDSILTHFNKNSVCIVHELLGEQTRVYVIGEGAEYIVQTSALKPFDVTQTGKGYDVGKICNVCHVLKKHNAFDPNQKDSKGQITTRPSCRDCRKSIDRQRISQKDKAKWLVEHPKPKSGHPFRCPICRKRTIAGVTGKVVLDHDHLSGKPRGWLCDSCNTGLGRFRNGEIFVKNILQYLKNPNPSGLHQA